MNKLHEVVFISLDVSFTPMQKSLHVLDQFNHLYKSSYSPPLYMRVACHDTPSQHPLLHLFFSLTCLNIVDAQTKFMKRSKSDLVSIDFENIEVRDVKYFPLSFGGDVLFELPLATIGVPNAYNHSMDGMDEVYDG